MPADTLTKSQRNALNVARGQADELRKKIKSLTVRDIEYYTHYGYAVEVTNILSGLEKGLKRG